LQRLGIGYLCKKGLKDDTPNQDDFSILIDGDTKIFGVFDGHGTNGHKVSHFVHTFLPKYVTTLQTIDKFGMIKAFEMVHKALSLHCENK
jgi:serine/threonine protein phosphatase PrpC